MKLRPRGGQRLSCHGEFRGILVRGGGSRCEVVEIHDRRAHASSEDLMANQI